MRSRALTTVSVLLACAASAIWSQTAASQNDQDDRIRKLMIERRDTLRKLVETVTIVFEQGLSSFDTVIRAQIELLDAELQLAATPQARIQVREKQLKNMLGEIQAAQQKGAVVLNGGYRLADDSHANGFYLAPTLIENVDPHDAISTIELFGPITCLYRVDNFKEALNLANDSPYGLTACIHTRNFHRAMQFTQKVQSGVAVVNAGTYGSEPHMPFGGLKQSGNGTREPGTEALDVYSELKNIIINIDPEKL